MSSMWPLTPAIKCTQLKPDCCVLFPKHRLASAFLQAPVFMLLFAKHCLASVFLQAPVCMLLFASTVLQAPVCMLLFAGTVLQAPPCKHLPARSCSQAPLLRILLMQKWVHAPQSPIPQSHATSADLHLTQGHQLCLWEHPEHPKNALLSTGSSEYKPSAAKLANQLCSTSPSSLPHRQGLQLCPGSMQRLIHTPALRQWVTCISPTHCQTIPSHMQSLHLCPGRMQEAPLSPALI
eukprot:1148221-Pelagomonas_calceolata.AAC.4